MIASPGDVLEERDIIRSVIHDWNDIHAALSEVMLAPIGWETHASPELGARAQELINTRILKDCDLLVGVFWTRLGTPTGKASSGTVEEIEEHLAAGKPAMIYFSSRPATPQSIDPDQFSEVQAFKAKCEKRGLIETFDDATELKEKFGKHLSICLAKNVYLNEVRARTLHYRFSSISVAKSAMFEDFSSSFSAFFSHATTVSLFFIHSRSWRENNHGLLLKFLQKRNSKMLHVFLPNFLNSDLIKQIVVNFEDGPYIPKLIEEAVTFFEKLRRRFPKKVKVLLFDFYPTYSFYKFNDNAVFALYPTTDKKKNVPAFQITKTSEFWSFLLDDLNTLVATSKVPSEEHLSHLPELRYA